MSTIQRPVSDIWASRLAFVEAEPQCKMFMIFLCISKGAGLFEKYPQVCSHTGTQGDIGLISELSIQACSFMTAKGLGNQAVPSPFIYAFSVELCMLTEKAPLYKNSQKNEEVK